MRRELPPRILKLQKQQKQLPPRMRRCLPPRVFRLQEEQLPPRMRRCLSPRICKLQEEQTWQAALKAESQAQCQQKIFFESLHAGVERLSELLKIQLLMLGSHQASIRQLFMRQQQEGHHRQRVLGDYFQQHPLNEEMIKSEQEQNKFKSKLVSFLGMEPNESTILMHHKAFVTMRQWQLQEEAMGSQRCAQQQQEGKQQQTTTTRDSKGCNENTSPEREY
ncbi:hypothetical protein ACOSQ3_018138 [Xanthoceras sorbifolium]